MDLSRPWVLLLLSATTLGAVPLPSVNLSNGLPFPLLGLGCSSGVRRQHVRSALEMGYRHLDTAQAFQWGYNETEVGLAIRDSGLERADLFLQSKIFPEDLGYSSTKKAFERSLERLKTDYLDSLLLHKPRCWPGACSKEPEGTWQESWKALEELYEAGRVRAIGICDVDGSIFEELLQQKHRAHIIQNWMDPFHQDLLMRRLCLEAGIQYQGYSTLGPQWTHFRGLKENPVLRDATLVSIAATHGRDVAQVVLSWAMERGVAVIPASRRRERQSSNLKSGELKLSVGELAAIDSLDGRLDRSDRDRAVVEFHNAGLAPVLAFYVGLEGESLVGKIPAGASLSQQTFHGHQWRFRREGEVVDTYIVDAHAKGGLLRYVVAGQPETGRGDL